MPRTKDRKLMDAYDAASDGHEHVVGTNDELHEDAGEVVAGGSS